MPDSKTPYSYDELLFARKMREVANTIRHQQTPAIRGRDDENQEEIELSTKERDAWLEANPLEDFVEEIVVNAMNTADAVREIMRTRKS